MNRTAKGMVSSLASLVGPVLDIISRKEERAFTAEIEKWMAERVILSVIFSYPKSYPAAKPCPERVVFKGQGWRAVYLENGMKLHGPAPAEITNLLRHLEQEHILNLQNLLRFVCEHSDKVRTEVDGFEASSKVLGYVLPDEMSGEKSAAEGFDLDFTWEVVRILPG
jgi:hypothetical protein